MEVEHQQQMNISPSLCDQTNRSQANVESNSPNSNTSNGYHHHHRTDAAFKSNEHTELINEIANQQTPTTPSKHFMNSNKENFKKYMREYLFLLFLIYQAVFTYYYINIQHKLFTIILL